MIQFGKSSRWASASTWKIDGLEDSQVVRINYGRSERDLKNRPCCLGGFCHSIFLVVYHRGERGGEESCDKRANKEVRGWSYPPVTAESNPINNEHLQPLARVSSWLNLGGTSGGVQKEWYNPDLYVLFDFKPLSLVTKRRAKLHRAPT